MNVEQLLSRIPSKAEIVKKGLECQLAQVLELVVAEFPVDDMMAKAQDNGISWKWYIEIPFDSPEILKRVIRDTLAEKGFDTIHFNGFGTQTNGCERMSLTIYKGEKPE